MVNSAAEARAKKQRAHRDVERCRTRRLHALMEILKQKLNVRLLSCRHAILCVGGAVRTGRASLRRAPCERPEAAPLSRLCPL